MAHESAYFTLGKVDGKHDVKALKKGLDTLPGVTSVSVNQDTGSVAVDFDNTGVTFNQLCGKLDEMGFSVAQSARDKLTE